MLKIALFSLLILAAHSLRAADVPLEVKDAWVLAVPPSSAATAAFMILVNTSDQPIRLTRCSSPIAGESAPMITTRQTVDGREVMGMETVDSLEIPAKGERRLEPGGDHLMLMQMKAVPKSGETVEITLTVEPGAHELKLNLPVRRFNEN